jgi:hypothetical protein
MISRSDNCVSGRQREAEPFPQVAASFINSRYVYVLSINAGFSNVNTFSKKISWCNKIRPKGALSFQPNFIYEVNLNLSPRCPHPPTKVLCGQRYANRKWSGFDNRIF